MGDPIVLSLGSLDYLVHYCRRNTGWLTVHLFYCFRSIVPSINDQTIVLVGLIQ